MQLAIFSNYDETHQTTTRAATVWIGNKQRFAGQIVSQFPRRFNRYYEPFLGSGAVLATLKPKEGIASDIFQPLVDIWKALVENPEKLKRWGTVTDGDDPPMATKWTVYELVKASYNAKPNGASPFLVEPVTAGW